uniref:Uncharacterized protein n=1 Tax=Arundo donax TaxID=35708 RepID=A0A0A9FIW0_ARUDO
MYDVDNLNLLQSNLTWEESVKRDLKDWNITKELAMTRLSRSYGFHL